MTEQHKPKTLRDEFAMAAITGLMAQEMEYGFSAEAKAKDAYEVADAMLAARSVAQANP